MTITYIKVGVDCDGVNTVLDNWKNVSDNDINAYNKATAVPIQACDALEIATSSASVNTSAKISSQMLAYYPTGNNAYRLCYEFIIDGDAYYVDAVNGAILNDV